MINVKTLNSMSAGSLQGVTLNRVQNALPKLGQAASVMLGRIDPPDSIKRFRITNALYDRVYNYTCATDLKGLNRIIDVRPIGPRSRRDEMDQTFMKEFDTHKRRNTLTIEDINGLKTLRISKRNPNGQVLLADLCGFDLSSTVTASGDANTLSQNDLDFVTGNGSTQFNLSGVTGQGVITIQLTGTVDISSMLNLGSLFNWINFPDVTRLTNVEQRWGINSSSYWKKQVTSPNDRPAFESQAWTNQRFDWQSATQVGTPDSTAIQWLQIIFNYTTGAALTGVKVDSITASLGSAYEMLYYSANIFQDQDTSLFKDIPTKDTDVVFLDQSATTILMYEYQKILASDLKGKNGAANVNRCIYELEGDGRIMRGKLIANRAGLYRDYQFNNPSQSIPSTSTYYEFGNLSGNGDDCDEDEDW